MLQFNDTKIAFSSKSTYDLKKAYWLFKTIEKPWVVRLGDKMLAFALTAKIPISWMLKPTIFSHFCGGETIAECESTIAALGQHHIGSILDYSAEGNQNESDFDFVMHKILEVIEKSKSTPLIPFAVFKVTGIARFELLEKVNDDKELTPSETHEFNKVLNRIDTICNAAYKAQLPVMLDAEESWIQIAIDSIAIEMMQKYNHSKAIVYNTLQMYRHDRIAFLLHGIEEAQKHNYFIGLKLVRGAYMEKERERATINGYSSPIHTNKALTDDDYDKAIRICMEHNSIVSVFVGSHNEKSNELLATLINQYHFAKDDKRFYFAQLYGMSDHISYNLAHDGYNVAKYVPFGPLVSVMPYLIRRAQENTSIAGQTGRELKLIKDELKRRKLE